MKTTSMLSNKDRHIFKVIRFES